MKFVTLRGNIKSVNIANYVIDWQGKSRSIFQSQVKDFLFPFWKSHIVAEELPVAGTRMTLDIVNLTTHVAVEVNGNQHVQYNSHMHGHSQANFRKQVKRDLSKAEWCEKNGFIFVEIYPKDMPLSVAWFLDNYNIGL